MTKKHSTKKALILSMLSLLLCFSMLVGTTFAWFTDSVSSVNNIITAGNLDVELYYQAEGQTDWTKATDTTNVFKENALWEPGHTEVVRLKVVNEGTLALKYQLGVNVASEITSTNVLGAELKLSDFIKFGIVDGTQTYTRDQAIAAVDATATALNVAYNSTVTSLEAKNDGNTDEKIVTMVVYMPTAVGNEANAKAGAAVPTINLGINLFATQMTAESDSFNDQYDKDAEFSVDVKNADELANALKVGGKVKLVGDIQLSNPVEVPVGVAVELDLNGKTISGSVAKADGPVIKNKGTLTIVGGTVSSTAKNGGSALYNEAGATMTIEDVTVNAPEFEAPGWPSYGINNFGTLTINGAEINTYHGGVATGGDGVTVINDADIDVGQSTETNQTSWAIYAYDNAQVTVNGGTFANTKNEYGQVYGGGYICTSSTKTVTINGGTFDKTEGDNNGTGFYYNNQNLVINGGTFDADPTAYVAPGYKVTESNGKYVVSVDLNNVCSANAFEDALAEGGNVNVTANIEVDDVVMIPEGKEVVLNLNGNTLSKSVDSGIVVRNYGKLTLTGNGTIDGTIGNYAIRTEAGSELTIGDNIVVDGGFGAVSCFGGKLTINGGDFSNEESNTTHYVVYATNNSTVVINGGTFTFADDQYAGANGSPILAATNGTTIEINGGTFDATGGSSLCYNANNIVIKGGTFKNKATATYGGTIEGKVADGYAVTKNGNVWTVAVN